MKISRGPSLREALKEERVSKNNQLTRFQVWPPQNMPPKAQPWTLSVSVLFSAIVEL